MLSNTHFAMATHVLSVLAYRKGELIGSEELAYSVGTNPSFLRGLIGQLRDAGLVETQPGKGGGARLARPASRVTLLDVYQATESGPAMRTHACDTSHECPVARNMEELLGEVAGRIEAVVEGELRRVTLGSLVAGHVKR
jgi:Rrf2 family protein